MNAFSKHPDASGGRKNHALVIGLGRSGVAASRLLCAHGYAVTLIDEGVGRTSVSVQQELENAGITVLTFQKHIPHGTFGLVVVSPGVPSDHPFVLAAQSVCEDVISELELGYRYCSCPIFAVTGTNGKSTLVALLDHMLSCLGLQSKACGNLGTPLCDLVQESPGLDWLVVEVSSFQLELIRDFRPRCAVLLNLQPDHLDRHKDMQTYLAIKCRIFEKMGQGDVAVVMADLLPEVRKILNSTDSDGVRWVPFGALPDWHYDTGAHAILGCDPTTSTSISIDVHESYFDQAITGQTAAAAVTALARCVEPDFSRFSKALRTFSPLPHRMQWVADLAGVGFINDSKATNMAAMCAAVSMQCRPVHLIAGGQLKEKDVFFAKQVLKKHVSCVYVIGDAADFLAQAWGEDVTVIHSGTLENAMHMIFKHVKPSEVVLLSPGCASFDQFRSYVERGEKFIQIVETRKQEVARSVG